MSSVLRRLAPAVLTALTLAATAGAGRAQVVYSGVLARVIPATGPGFYQNVVNGTFHTGPGTFPSCPGAGCNYDFSIFGRLSTFSPPSGAGETSPTPPSQRGFVAADVAGLPVVLAPGSMIGSMSIFNPGGTGTGNFFGGADQIFGFRFRNEEGGANTLHYGWARITLPATGSGTLVDYAWNATPGAAIAAGDVGAVTPPPSVVPEPSTYALLGVGLAGVGAVARRRRA